MFRLNAVNATQLLAEIKVYTGTCENNMERNQNRSNAQIAKRPSEGRMIFASI